MIDTATAWQRFLAAQAKMDECLETYTRLYVATAERLRVITYQRTGERLTLDQAKAQVDALTRPDGFSRVNEAWELYKRWRDDTKVWKDIWHALRDQQLSVIMADD